MKAKHLLIEVAFLLTLTYLFPNISLSQGTWTQKADFGGGERYSATGFSIGNKGYLGLGFDYLDDSLRDIWEWDPVTNTWTKKADFWPMGTFYPVSFSIGTKGYLLSGTGYNGITYAQELWEYDPVADTWTQKASVPTGTPARESAVGFSIGTKGYIGIGHKIDSLPGSYYQDFWEYDQTTNTWTKKADFKGAARVGAIGFSIGNKGYIGTGFDGSNAIREFWEWDQGTNVWTRKADFGGTAEMFSSGFSIGNKGYIGTTELWEWDQATNIWTQKTGYKGYTGEAVAAFSIGNKAYMGTGYGGPVVYASKDFWEFDPLETTGIAKLAKENSSIYPNPASNLINFNFNIPNNADVVLDIYSVTGTLVKTVLLNPNQHQINVTDLKNGIYMIEVKSNNWLDKQKLIVQR